MNGEIEANILAVKEGKPLSFTSMNGEIALHLPETAKANVRLRTRMAPSSPISTRRSSSPRPSRSAPTAADGSP
jgi:hypothetical protein